MEHFYNYEKTEQCKWEIYELVLNYKPLASFALTFLIKHFMF
jgi:hypothetical protein